MKVNSVNIDFLWKPHLRRIPGYSSRYSASTSYGTTYVSYGDNGLEWLAGRRSAERGGFGGGPLRQILKIGKVYKV